MRAISSPRAAEWGIPAREPHREGPIHPGRHSMREDPLQRTVEDLRSIAPATLRLLAVATIAMVLIIVSLPAANAA